MLEPNNITGTESPVDHFIASDHLLYGTNAELAEDVVHRQCVMFNTEGKLVAWDGVEICAGVIQDDVEVTAGANTQYYSGGEFYAFALRELPAALNTMGKLRAALVGSNINVVGEDA